MTRYTGIWETTTAMWLTVLCAAVCCVALVCAEEKMLSQPVTDARAGCISGDCTNGVGNCETRPGAVSSPQ